MNRSFPINPIIQLFVLRLLIILEEQRKNPLRANSNATRVSPVSVPCTRRFSYTYIIDVKSKLVVSGLFSVVNNLSTSGFVTIASHCSV